jgi:hypothetical protein
MSYEDQQKLWTLQAQQRAACDQEVLTRKQSELVQKQMEFLDLATRVFEKLEKYLDRKL